MDFEAITIRSAESKDVKEIWDLLHADCRSWSEVQISENLHQLLILAKGNRLLGVLYGDLNPYKIAVFWVAIHPLYPEMQFNQLFIQALQGIQGKIREPKDHQQTSGVLACDSEV